MKRGETKTFYYVSTTSTDQEVIVYHAQYIKALDNLSNLNPSSCILANAKKLTNVEIHSTELYNINVTNNTFLRSINLEGCSTLGTVTATGSSLDLSNCKYLRYCNVYNTALTEVQLNTSGGSLIEILYPKTIQSINLIKQRLLEKIGLPYGSGGEEIPTSLYTISIQECPSIKYLNTSDNSAINTTFASMVYCNNLTIRNSLDLKRLTFDGFYRLKNVIIENMYNLEELGFNDLLPKGDASTLQYIGLSNCPLLEVLELNCTSNEYEITFANKAILNLGGLFGLKSIESNCVLKGIETIVVPLNLESMFFTNEYGEGYSTIKNIWSSSVCTVNTAGSTAKAQHINPTYVGIDFAGMSLKNIDLGALVNIPKAINFTLYPTTVNPHFNLNRDGENYPYLQPVGTLDLSNYTESLAKFFDGVDLDKLKIVCTNKLPQTDLSYCFYNATFSNDTAINTLLSKVSSITNLDYCFYKTTVADTSILSKISMGESSTMNYTFAECPNITTLKNVTIPSTVIEVEGMFYKCPLKAITNMIVNVNGSISGLFKGCTELTTISTLRIPNVTDVSSTFEGCSSLATLTGFELPSSCTNVSNLFNGCYMLTELSMNFSSSITAGENWYPPNLETLNDTTISNDYVKLTNCSTLKNINNLTLRVSDITNFFTGTTSLKNINGLDIGGTLTSVESLFKNRTLDALHNITFGASITNFTSCFENVPCITNTTLINMPNHENKTLNYSRMFAGCLGITQVIDTIYPDSGTNYSHMYTGCTNITKLSNLTIQGGILLGMFSGCTGITSVSNVVTSNATSMSDMFSGCTKITSITLNVPNTCKNIDRLLQGCSMLTDISGSTFGSGITSATNWCPPNLTTADDITIKSFINRVPVILFTNISSLISAKNLKLIKPSNIPTITLNNMFAGCINLEVANFVNPPKIGYCQDLFKATSIGKNTNGVVRLYEDLGIGVNSISGAGAMGMFSENTYIKEFIFPDEEIGSFYAQRLFDLCTNLKIVRNLKSSDLGLMFRFCRGASDVELINCYLSKPFVADGCREITKLTNCTIPSNITNINRFFTGMNIQNDIEIPSHITSCVETFKNCTSMTHIHSNWENEYDNEITSTDCYAGCTGITHIDDENIVTYEGKEGLDEIPMAWGGYEFTKINTTVLEVVIPSDNYKLCMYGYDTSLDTKRFLTSWGDKTSDTLSYHTYQKAGTYIIKTKFNQIDSSNPAGNIRKCVTKILQVRSNNIMHLFRECIKLTYVNIDDCTIDKTSFLYQCNSQVVEISSKNAIFSIPPWVASKIKLKQEDIYTWDISNLTDMNSMFGGCVNTSLDISNWDVSRVTNMSYMFSNCNNLVTLDLSRWVVDNVKNMSNMFNQCHSLTTLIGLENWNVSKVTDMRGMFNWCESLVRVDFLTNWNINNVTSIGSMFNCCKKLTEVNFNPDTYMSNYSGSLGSTFRENYELTRISGLKLNPEKLYNTQNAMDGFIGRTYKIRYIENMYLGGSNPNAYNIFAYSDRGAIPDNSVTFIWDNNSIFKGFDTNLFPDINIRYEALLRICTPKSRQSFAENVYDRVSNGLDTITVSGLGSQYLNEEQIALITSKGYTLVN